MLQEEGSSSSTTKSVTVETVELCSGCGNTTQYCLYVSVLPSGTASGGILKILLRTLTSDVLYSGDGMPFFLQSSAKIVDGFFASCHLL